MPDLEIRQLFNEQAARSDDVVLTWVTPDGTVVDSILEEPGKEPKHGAHAAFLSELYDVEITLIDPTSVNGDLQVPALQYVDHPLPSDDYRELSAETPHFPSPDLDSFPHFG